MTFPLDSADVRAAAAAAVGRPVRTVDYQVDPIDPALRLHSVTGGVLRVRGKADGAPFSLVVKRTQLGVDEDPGALWVSGATPTHRGYWKREWLAYASGLLGSLPGRLRAPRLLLATEDGPAVADLWLEDVPGRPGVAWQLPDYAAAAYDLGTTQGAYLAGTATLPDSGWLSRGWLRSWVQTTERWQPLVEADGAWRDPRLKPLSALRTRARRVWERRADLLAAVSAAPVTLVHLDFWPTNLIAGADGRTVALDWSVVGLGAIGQDLDQLTLDPVWMQVQPGGDLAALEAAVLPSYAEGLRDAGAEVSAAEVRMVYAAAAALHYGSFLGVQAELAADAARVAAAEHRWSRPFPAIAADRARVIARALDLAQEHLAAK